MEQQISFESGQGGANAPSSREMPDIARDGSADIRGTLDRVGMSHIEMPIRILGPAGEIQVLPAVIDAYVSLDAAEEKGIHMSRMFLTLQDKLERQVLDFDLLEQVLAGFLASHEGLSESASVRISFDWMRKRRALVSDNLGWRTYPVVMEASTSQGRLSRRLETTITYSSTCPCSAALARQLIQERFDQAIRSGLELSPAAVRAWLGTPEAICATPHSQRSTAEVRVSFAPGQAPATIDELIDRSEDALQTVVQAAVKREDEQAFALLNGENLMFCEDAARRMKAALNDDARLEDFWVKVNHQESLHPHNATAVVTKGVEGGFRP